MSVAPARFTPRGELDLVDACEAALGCIRDGRPRHLGYLISRAFDQWGVLDTWDHLLAPVLGALGDCWFDGELNVADESIATGVVLNELRDVLERKRPRDANADAIILGGAEGDQHGMPLVALQAGLAANGLASTNLGPRLTLRSLRHAVTRKIPRVVFVWASTPQPPSGVLQDIVCAGHHHAALILGGPGWDTNTANGASPSPTSLTGAVRAIAHALD